MGFQGWAFGLNGVVLSGSDLGSQVAFANQAASGTVSGVFSTACSGATGQVLGCLTLVPDGLGLPDLTTEDVRYLQRDGARHYNDWYNPRTITLDEVSVQADGCPTCPSMRQKVQKILAAWSRQCNDVEGVIWTDCNGTYDATLPDPLAPGCYTTSVRTNLCTNPSFETDLTGVTPYSGTSPGATTNTRMTTSGPMVGAAYSRVTVTTSPGTNVWGYGNGRRMAFGAASPGDVITYSTWIRCSVATHIDASGAFFDSGGGYLGPSGDSSKTQIAIPANVWVRISLTSGVAPANTSFGAVSWYSNDPAAKGVGVTLDLDGELQEKASSMLPYFDGSLANSALYTYAWAGTVNKSASTATFCGGTVQAENRVRNSPGSSGTTNLWNVYLGGSAGTLTAVVQDGRNAFKVVKTATDSNTQIGISGGFQAYPELLGAVGASYPGESVTMSAFVMNPAGSSTTTFRFLTSSGQGNTTDANVTITASSDGTLDKLFTIPADGVWRRIWITFTVLAGFPIDSMYLWREGGVIANGEVFFASNIMVSPGALRNWFDGNSPTTYDPIAGGYTTYGWASTAYDSTSYQMFTPATYNNARSIVGPYGVIGRPRVALVDYVEGGQKIATLTLRFDAVDQRLYILDACGTPGSGTRSVQVNPTTATQCRNYPRCYTSVCSPGVSGSAYTNNIGSSTIVTAAVSGTICSQPTITLTGSLTSPEVHNLTTGQILYYGRNIISGEIVTINTMDGTATSSINGDSTYLLSGDTRLRLDPGNNTIYLASYSVGDTGNAKISWRDAVVMA